LIHWTDLQKVFPWDILLLGGKQRNIQVNPSFQNLKILFMLGGSLAIAEGFSVNKIILTSS